MNNYQNDLNSLIEQYQYIINNFYQLNENFELAELNSSILKLNLANLINIRELLINKNFDAALDKYNSMTLYKAQKSLVKQIINYYQSNPTLSYQMDLSSNSASHVAATEVKPELASQEQIEQLKEITKFISTFELSIDKISSNLISNIQSLLPTKETKANNAIDYDKLNTIINKTIASQFKSETELLNAKLNGCLPEVIDKISELMFILTTSKDFYKRNEEISKLILESTIAGVKEANSKIYPDLKNVVAEAIKIELKAFFESVQKHVESSRKDGLSYQSNAIKLLQDHQNSTTKSLQEHQNKSRSSTHYWGAFAVSLMIISVVATGYFSSKMTAKNTVALILSLQKK